ncbi:hypothetical protein [Cellulosimicrobium cellulans]|uniref:hypothetical protein n=1 Tax=Cellulosimicrobium cellulans TaxID=1710 RepID=UPI00130E129B|nr:hypothetical protein [Cellulosimicrobium cellulans]
MPRPGPRRELVGAKILPDTVARLDANAVAGAGSRSDVARLGIELAAAGIVNRRPGLCHLHNQREDAMFVLVLPNDDEWWFCETTQRLTQGTAVP